MAEVREIAEVRIAGRGPISGRPQHPQRPRDKAEVPRVAPIGGRVEEAGEVLPLAGDREQVETPGELLGARRVGKAGPHPVHLSLDFVTAIQEKPEPKLSTEEQALSRGDIQDKPQELPQDASESTAGGQDMPDEGGE